MFLLSSEAKLGVWFTAALPGILQDVLKEYFISFASEK